jgi:putative cell wall-binding protein
MPTSRLSTALLPLLATLSALTLAAVLLPTAAAAQDEPEDRGVTPARAHGPTRHDTASRVATLTFDEARTAILVTGDDYPDALAGSYAAGRVVGPLLLVQRDQIPDSTREALRELAVEEVVLLGGTGVIGEEVEDQLRAEGYVTDRIAGSDRFETAAEIALRYADGMGTFEGQRTAILASGQDFPDALAAGPLAARARLPLLLTPRDSTLPVVNETLETLDIERILVVGGPAAVSGDVVRTYEEAGYAVERFSGGTRTGTAAVIADNAIARAGFVPDLVLLARGDDFPDALTASIHGAVLGAPILLTATPDVLSPETADWLAARCPDVDAIRALGGRAAVSEATLSTAVDAGEACLRTEEEVARFTTPLLGRDDRTHNIHLAADYIDGDVIPPGEAYSLDAHIGNRSRARGFREVENGCIGSDGEPVDCVGGGISQLATTFMNAAWFTGVKFGYTEADKGFRQHTIYFERYPMCHESTISRGSIDVVVRNDSPYPITIDTFYTDEFVGVRYISEPWAEVESWTSEPYARSGSAFSVDCGRTITYPDGTRDSEAYSWRYDDTGF